MKRKPSDIAVEKLLREINAVEGGEISLEAIGKLLPNDVDRLRYIVIRYRAELRKSRRIYSRQRNRIVYFLTESGALHDGQRGMVKIERSVDRHTSRVSDIDPRKLETADEKQAHVNLARESTALLTAARTAVKQAAIPNDVRGMPRRLHIVNDEAS